MLRLVLEQKISTVWEAEQHVYGIPAAGVMCSRDWTSLTNSRRVALRTRAIELWKQYLESDNAVIPHPPIRIPEYRQMLTQPDGEPIVEELD
jgi:hypothetical protein